MKLTSGVWGCLVVLAVGSSAYAQDHLDLVRLVKSELILKGVSLDGPCGAFEITKRVAWGLRNEGYGLLGGKTPAQNGCSANGDKYAVDWLLKSDGHGIDILSDAGGTNTPVWIEETASSLLYRPAFDPQDTPAPPTPIPPTPLPPVQDPEIAALREQIVALTTIIDTLTARLAHVLEDLAALNTRVSDDIVTLKARPLPPSGCRVTFLRCRLEP